MKDGLKDENEGTLEIGRLLIFMRVTSMKSQVMKIRLGGKANSENSEVSLSFHCYFPSSCYGSC